MTITLVTVCMCSIFCQILNGDFEEWEFYNNSEIPAVWLTGIESTDYSSVMLKDSESFSGNYCLKMIGGTVYSEGDCERFIAGIFNLPQTSLDSICFSFAYKSESKNSDNQTNFVVYINGVSKFISTEPIENYEEIQLKFLNSNEETFHVRFESHKLGSAFDGCPNISDHWIDDVKIYSGQDQDSDGYDNLNDCDDQDSTINPNAEEVIYNGIDDDCNSETLDDDLDEDGFDMVNDCDDQNASINPGANEIYYNGIDDDCNSETLDDDQDGDGYDNLNDCDDQNAFVNPDANEIIYNGLDDDCNPETLDDDLDGDGFDIINDCDDNNASINPSTPEIPNNGIDENCDGMDLVSNLIESLKAEINVYPNPSSGILNIQINNYQNELKLRVIDINGTVVLLKTINNEFEILDLNEGFYLLEISDIAKSNKLHQTILITK